MTLRDLINDLVIETGGRSDVASRLPLFIQNVEDALWPQLEGFAQEDTETLTVTSGATEVSVSDSLWLRVMNVFDSDGNKLERKTLYQIDQLIAENSGSTLEYFYWNYGGALKVAYAPSEDKTLYVSVLKREQNLTFTSTSTDSFFLGKGYNLLKYGVLSMRVFDPEKWPAWKQQYERELRNIHILEQQHNLTPLGQNNRRWF